MSKQNLTVAERIEVGTKFVSDTILQIVNLSGTKAELEEQMQQKAWYEVTDLIMQIMDLDVAIGELHDLAFRANARLAGLRTFEARRVYGVDSPEYNAARNEWDAAKAKLAEVE